MKYFILAGHDKNGDPGAQAYDGTFEVDYTIELRNLIVDKLTGKYFHTTNLIIEGTSAIMRDADSEKLWETINKVNQVSNGATDFLLDIHFDWNPPQNPNASGSKSYHAQVTSKENIRRATELSGLVAGILGIPNQGAKSETESYCKSLGILSRTRPSALLIEVCYLTKKDLDNYRSKVDLVAEGIAEWIANLSPASNKISK